MLYEYFSGDASLFITFNTFEAGTDSRFPFALF